MRIIPLVLSFVGFALSPVQAFAVPFNEACPDIPACAKVAGELLGQKYLFDAADVKGKVQATPNLELTKENAEWLFTNMLYLQGFSRVPQGAPSTFIILRQRDAKDSAIPLYESSQHLAPSLPNNWDYATLRYKATNPDVVNDISRATRNFMPPNSRIIASDVSGTILVTDAAPNLRKMYEIVKDLDRKPSPEIKKRWQEEEHLRRIEASQRRHEEPQPRPAEPHPPAQH